SPSISQTSRPARARAKAICTARVVLPTPPLVFPTVIITFAPRLDIKRTSKHSSYSMLSICNRVNRKEHPLDAFWILKEYPYAAARSTADDRWKVGGGGIGLCQSVRLTHSGLSGHGAARRLST